MSTGPVIQKNFKEFKPMRKKWKMMNKLFINGKLKGSFFQKEANFEMVVVFTGVKMAVLDVQLLENKVGEQVTLKDKRFKLDFTIGDHIDKVKQWVDKNGHEIDFEQIRF